MSIQVSIQRCLVFIFTMTLLTLSAAGNRSYGNRPQVYWTDLETSKIQRANLDGSNVEVVVTLGGVTIGPYGIALDVTGDKVYWGDWINGIVCADLDGSNVDTVTPASVNPADIALDVLGGKMYWTDWLLPSQKIQRMNLDGTNLQDIVTITEFVWPNGIALDIGGGKVYWTELITGKLRRANLDGSSVEDIPTTGRAPAGGGIALDIAAGKMYWTDVTSNTIWRSNLDGTKVEAIVTTSPDSPGDLALDLERGKIYWTYVEYNADTKKYSNGRIQRANLDGTNVQTIVTGLENPNRIALSIAPPNPPPVAPKPPDLVIDSYSIDATTLDIGDSLTVAPGDSITFSAIIKNIGTGQSSSTTLRYYRSSDANLSSSDTEVGTDTIGVLAPNQTADANLRLTPPTAPGTYYYGMCVDSVDRENRTDNNCSDAEAITVIAVADSLVKISGDNQQGVAGSPLANPFVVEVRDQGGAPFAGATVTFAVTAGGGTLNTTRELTDASGRTQTTLTLGSNVGTNTVSASVAGIEQPVTFNVIAEGMVFNLSLPAGISLIHVPLKVTTVDGLVKPLRSIADLYDALGGADAVTFLITYDTSTQTWLSYFSTSDTDTAADAALTDVTGIVASMKAEASVVLSGSPLGTNGNGAITLSPGLNLVGLPLRDSRINRVSDLLSLEGSLGNVSVIILAHDGDFKAVGRAGDPGDIPITGGQGFILTAQRQATADISGEGWTNDSTTAAAPVARMGIKVGNITPVLALSGAIVDESTRVNRAGFRVSVKNLSTGRIAAVVTTPHQAGYRLTVVDIETNRAATVGDTLEITAQSPNRFIGVEPLRYTVTAKDVKRGLIRLPELVAYQLPTKTVLLANYPNPFNPETWIPYHLSQDAVVSLTIYDTQGVVVRRLALGHQQAGFYTDRNRAAYWDGRNAVGEQVASGVYFYHLDAGEYSAIRRMVILK